MTPYEDKTYKDHLKEEKAKLKTMSPKDKIWYIWEYYKFPIIGVLIAVFCTVSIGSAIYQNRFDTALSCVILNGKFYADEPPVDSYINEGFREYIGLDENTKLDVDYSMSLTFDESQMSDYSYAEMAKITALISAKSLDVMIGNPDTIGHYGEMGGFCALDETLPDDLYAAVKDHLFTAVNQETGEEVVCGVYLDSSSFQENTGLELDTPILAIMDNTEHTDASIAFLRYILGL